VLRTTRATGIPWARLTPTVSYISCKGRLREWGRFPSDLHPLGATLPDMTQDLVVPRAAASLGVDQTDIRAVVHKNRIELMIPDQPISVEQLMSLAASFKVETRTIAFLRGPLVKITIPGNFL
jgi:hypothetical protein